MDLSDALYEAFTRGQDTATKVPETGAVSREGVGAMISALGGTRAALDALGVPADDRKARAAMSRNLQRYSTTTAGQKRAAPAGLVARLRTAVRDNPSHRAQVMGVGKRGNRAARLRNSGATVRAKGMQGVQAGTRSYARERAITHRLEGEALAPALDAFLRGDDERAAELFTQAMQDTYTPGWEMPDLDELDLRR